jgi:hypothetical protein
VKGRDATNRGLQRSPDARKEGWCENHKRLFSDGAGQGPSAFLLDVVLLFTLDCQMVNWQSIVPHRVPEASQAENPA